MVTRRQTRGEVLAEELRRLQTEFKSKYPEIAEALEVMDISLAEYLAALGYLRDPEQSGGASDECILVA